MAKITYTNKVNLNTNPEIPAENKVSAADMNEIKESVNALYDEADTKLDANQVVNTQSNSQTDTYSCDYSNKNFKGVELWSGTPTASEITLTIPTTGYSYVEIYGYATSGEPLTGNRVFAKINNPIDCAFYLTAFDIDATNNVLYLKTATCVINSTGTKISFGNNFQWWHIAGSSSGGGSSGNYLKIYKVVGYK